MIWKLICNANLFFGGIRFDDLTDVVQIYQKGKIHIEMPYMNPEKLITFFFATRISENKLIRYSWNFICKEGLYYWWFHINFNEMRLILSAHAPSHVYFVTRIAQKDTTIFCRRMEIVPYMIPGKFSKRRTGCLSRRIRTQF